MGRADESDAGRVAAPLVVLEGITKTFPGVVANDGVDLSLRSGEIHALVGENGAGKSTLMRVLYGLYPPDSGRIVVRGEEVKVASPRQAIARGIGMVHQHFMLVDRFTVAENVVLGAENGLLWDEGAAADRVRELGRAYGLGVDPDALVEELSVGEEQRVEIIKALYRGADLLILDEPTAVLTPGEAKDLFRILRALRDAGKTVVFISHKLDEVLAVADRITVLRRGKVVGETSPSETSKEKLAEMMVGRPVLFRLEKPSVKVGGPVLRVDRLQVGEAVKSVGFEVHAGEILGIAGVEGNGQLELAEAIMGLRRPDSGSLTLDLRDITGASVSGVRARGVAYVPEDRHDRGLVLDMALWENALLGRQGRKEYIGRFGRLLISKIKELASRLIQAFDIRARSINVEAATLSGGNQQKLILARELDGEPSLVIAHQPTRGLDVGAIEFVWRQLLEQKAAGRAVLLISAELEEIFELSDRILTIYEGKISGHYSPDTPPEKVGLGMTGGKGRAS
ncbi:MAG: ABC transporter ATP-binding protein [Actinomycetota bacterium]